MLKDMKQYYFDRDVFVKTVNEIIPNLLDILADHGDTLYTDYFHCFRYTDEFYIIHLQSGTMINWYKHLGRTNTCNKNISLDEFKEFIKSQRISEIQANQQIEIFKYEDKLLENYNEFHEEEY